MSAPEGGAVVPEYSVGEFSRRFARMVANHPKLQRIAIVGEITDLRRWDGHLNMTLKEGEAVLGCFSFASEVRSFPVLREGLTVRAEGSIEVRPNRSLYQLRAITVSLVGEGKVAAETEELRMRLRAEGAFDASRKRPIPAFPRRIVLVTSDDDARADFEQRLRGEAPNIEVIFLRTRVQGKGAEIEIAEALDRAAKVAADVVVVTRGGGSRDDRLTFNLEPVVRAILRSRHPVITALGHLKDRHLADEVADLALATPTAAAVHLGKEWAHAHESMVRLNSALMRGFRSLLAAKLQGLRFTQVALERSSEAITGRRRERLRRLERELELRSPAARVAAWRLRTVQAQSALARSTERLQQVWLRRLERAVALLDGADPTRPLLRGFAIVTKDGSAVVDASALSTGDLVSARLQRGTFDARVESVRAE